LLINPLSPSGLLDCSCNHVWVDAPINSQLRYKWYGVSSIFQDDQPIPFFYASLKELQEAKIDASVEGEYAWQVDLTMEAIPDLLANFR
jgi:hypothetical protein